MAKAPAIPVKVKGTGAAKLAPGAMVAPKDVVDAIKRTPGTRKGKGLRRAHIPRGGAKIPKFAVGTFYAGRGGDTPDIPEGTTAPPSSAPAPSTPPPPSTPTTPEPTNTTAPSTTTTPASTTPEAPSTPSTPSASAPQEPTGATLPPSVGVPSTPPPAPAGPSTQDLTNAALGNTEPSPPPTQATIPPSVGAAPAAVTAPNPGGSLSGGSTAPPQAPTSIGYTPPASSPMQQFATWRAQMPAAEAPYDIWKQWAAQAPAGYEGFAQQYMPTPAPVAPPPINPLQQFAQWRAQMPMADAPYDVWKPWAAQAPAGYEGFAQQYMPAPPAMPTPIEGWSQWRAAMPPTGAGPNDWMQWISSVPPEYRDAPVVQDLIGFGQWQAQQAMFGQAGLPSYDVGSYNVQKQGPAQQDPTAGIEQRVKRAIEQTGVGAPQSQQPSPQQTQQTQTTPTPGSGAGGGGGYMRAGMPSQRQQATLPGSIGAIGGTTPGTGSGQNRGAGGGPSQQDLTNAALGQGQSHNPSRPAQTGGGATIPNQWSATNPPTLTPAQLQAKLNIGRQIGTNTMASATNPTVPAGAWQGGVPGTAMNAQVMQALSALNAQRQAQAAGGDWTVATWADLPANLRPPGPTLPAFKSGSYNVPKYKRGTYQVEDREITDFYRELMPYRHPLPELPERHELPLRLMNDPADQPLEEVDREELFRRLMEEYPEGMPLPDDLRERLQNRARLPRFDVGTYGRDEGTTAIVHEGEEIYPPETAAQVRSDAAVPDSGSVMDTSGTRTHGVGGSDWFNTAQRGAPTGVPSARMGQAGVSETPAQKQARLDPTWVERHQTVATPPPTGGGTQPPATQPPAGGTTPLPPGGGGTGGGATLPDFLRRTAANLPNPNQIVARNWIDLDPRTRDLMLAAYESRGWDPSYIQHLIPQLLPGRAGVAPGTTGRILR